MLTNNRVMTEPGFVPDTADPLAGATLLWPPAEQLPEYERTLRRYVAEVTRVNHDLNRLLFASLGLGEVERLSLATAPFTVLKQMRYMPMVGARESGSLGAGAHADWVSGQLSNLEAGVRVRYGESGCIKSTEACCPGPISWSIQGALTVLATDGTPGLEVELGGEWLAVPPREGCLIINAGDQISHWTNGEYRSATHRVLHSIPKPRFSTAFFTCACLSAHSQPSSCSITPGNM